MTVSLSKITDLAARLQASCSGDENYEVNDLTLEECKVLDSIVFECQGCNHWFHQRDNATPTGSQWFCKDCADDRK